MMMGPPI